MDDHINLKVAKQLVSSLKAIELGYFFEACLFFPFLLGGKEYVVTELEFFEICSRF